MKKRWMQYGLLGVAIVAAGIGITQVKHHGSADNSWLAAVEQRATGNTSGSKGANPSNVPVNGSLAQNAPSQSPGSGVPASVVSPPQKPHTGPVAKSFVGSGTQPSSSNHTARSGNQTNQAPVPTQPGSTAPAPDLGSFTVVVSEDKGQTLISRKTVKIASGETLMAYMHQNYDITTAYGDDFMVSINGIKSQWTNVPPAQRQPVDWFLYVNGTSAPVGAGDIVPRAGDVDTWDYHRWDPSTGKG